MATGTLTGSTIATTYKSLLKVKGGANTILDADIQLIEDGDGVDSVLGLATDSALISGNGSKLYFYDADGGEYISADNAGVLSIAAGAEIDLTATAVDLNGTLDVSGTLTLAGNADFNGDLDVDGTANLDAVDIDGAVQLDATLSVGVDGTGYDVKFFGDTATNGYMLWDRAADDLKLGSSSRIGIGGAPGRSLSIFGTSTAYMNFDATSYIDWLIGSAVEGFIIYDADNSKYKFIIDANSSISLSNNLDLNTGNTVFGKSAWNIASTSTNNASDYNTVIGELAMGAGTIAGATYNTAVGFQSLQDVTSADNNNCFGSGTGGNLTTGSKNIAIGNNAIRDSQDVDSAVIIGDNAGLAVMTAAADGTVGIGAYSLAALTTGAGNVAVGYQNSTALSIGRYNTAVGTQALYSDTVGDRSTAIGYNALYSQVSDSNNEITGNTALGMYAGFYNIIGTNNTYLGYNAGFGASGESNSNNTAVGADALLAITTGSGNTVVGKAAGDSINSGVNNVNIGYGAGDAMTDAGNNVIIGCAAAASGVNFSTGDQCVIIGSSADTSAYDAQNQTAIGYDCNAVADNSVTLGNANVTAVYMSSDSGASVNCGAVSIEGSGYSLLGTHTNSTLADVGGGSIEFVAPYSGSVASGDTMVFTYPKGDWGSSIIEISCAGSDIGYSFWRGGFYNNGSTTDFETEEFDTNARGTLTASNDSQTSIFTLTFNDGITHPVFNIKYIQGGDCGSPVMSSASLVFTIA